MDNENFITNLSSDCSMKYSPILENIQLINRSGTFDAGHRVMNESMKCFNIHGHTYHYVLYFSFTQSEELGYAIDFKEIKRVFMQWIDDYLDHGMILNVHDSALIETVVEEYGSKCWLMSLNGEDEYCNPSVENIVKEVFLAMEIITDTLYGDSTTGLQIHEVRINETPNCGAHCTKSSIPQIQRVNFYEKHYKSITDYAKDKGVQEYDDRK